MSSSAITGGATTTVNTSPKSSSSSSSSAYSLQSLRSLGLGNFIAIALGFLVLLSTLLLAFYVCRRRYRDSAMTHAANNPSPVVDGVILPRIIFVAEGEDDDEETQGQPSPVPGLDQAAINSYPKFPFSKSKPLGDSLCSICLCEYREGEMLRMMSDCRHYFHLTCVDAWLRLNASCPVCRTSPMPTPLSTPLSELVPLSQYSADRRRR